MPKRRLTKTPLEDAIDGVPTDRRLRFDQAQRDAGMVKITFWVPGEFRDDVLRFGKLLREGDAEAVELLDRVAGTDPV